MYKIAIKPFFDVVCTFIAFVILSPIFLIIWFILLFINDFKPIFLQKRPGKNEKIFSIMKFKTMTDGKDSNGDLLPDADRLTKFGDFLRKTSLDEIPQLLNVLKGDMSLVGPRPLRVRYLPYYTKEESIRHTIKPGITGLAQVSGRNSLNWDEKLALDIDYTKNASFYLDFKILLKTVKKIFWANSDEIIIDLEMNALDTYRSNKNIEL